MTNALCTRHPNVLSITDSIPATSATTGVRRWLGELVVDGPAMESPGGDALQASAQLVTVMVTVTVTVTVTVMTVKVTKVVVRVRHGPGHGVQGHPPAI